MATANPTSLSTPHFFNRVGNRVEENRVPEVDPPTFSAPRFLKDAEEFCKILGAPFSASTTEAVLKAYSAQFTSAAVLWRVTSKDAVLNYRFGLGLSTDTVTTAIQAGFIKPGPLVDLVQSWSKLFNGEVEQWCDFDTATGFGKSWLFLGQTRQMEDILDLEFVPDSVRRHLKKFNQLKLNRVRTLAVDWHSKTLNIYWRVQGPLSKKQADELLELAGCQPLDESEVEEISKFSSARDGSFAFAVTMSIESGEIGRTAFYATKVVRGNLPVINERLETFIRYAPQHDPEEWISMGWGFAKGGKKYMKVEKSYCGNFAEKMKVLATQDPNVIK